uniref:X8 domain-containing protein n=1 Tax=Davidia involucrata TaxID=16924 RepID=A0A5B6ZQ02_DAVIN
METSRFPMNLCIFGLYLCGAAISFTHCADARRPIQLFRGPTHARSPIIKTTKKVKVFKHLDSSNTQPYGVSAPFTLPPYDSLVPIPLPENTPPFCIYPPFTPQPPSTTIPTPTGGITPPPPPPPSSLTPTPPFPIQSPPQIVFGPPGNLPGPPEFVPGPPIYVPSPTEPVLSPPYSCEPSPPSYVPSPPFNVPSPTGFVPSPPIFLPPVVYPPPTVPPPPHTSPSITLWCVAKPTVPEPIIQEAMNYACGSGADCDSIQPNGLCFEPNTVIAHASYAFNSYWQRTKVAGGICEFGGAAMLVSVDPSNDGCHFIYY